MCTAIENIIDDEQSIICIIPTLSFIIPKHFYFANFRQFAAIFSCQHIHNTNTIKNGVHSRQC